MITEQVSIGLTNYSGNVDPHNLDIIDAYRADSCQTVKVSRFRRSATNAFSKVEYSNLYGVTLN